MKDLMLKVLNRAGSLADAEPLIALFLGGALLAVFFTALVRPRTRPEADAKPQLFWMFYHQLRRFCWAAALVTLLLLAFTLLRTYLHRTLANFERTHGRITQVNYNAVQTIWGGEQSQSDLNLELYYEEEVTDRIESEDVTKPALLRKKIVRHNILANPILAAQHTVTLNQNPRKKGSAYYTGYETDCHFTWRLQNPAERELKSILSFPLPSADGMYNDLVATLDGRDILSQLELKNGALVLTRDFKPGEALDLKISFRSRGMTFWYFRGGESRQLRDFKLTLNLPDLPKARLNYPGECMTPTDIAPTADGKGCVLTYRLASAISNKGMGIILPSITQPGTTTRAVLNEIETGWLLIFAWLVLTLTLTNVRHAVLIAILFATGAAVAYGLLGDFSDLLFGFWGTLLLVLLPLFVVLASLLRRTVPGGGKLLAAQLLLYGIVYPCVAALDSDRQALYLNLCGLLLLAFTARLLLQRLNQDAPGAEAKA